jgi:16S rRNA (adenine1518-N6/adenine1519-N6)-dimethyltransferase
MTTNPRPLKRFGQNFLINPHISEKIAQALSITPQDTILEIGPGRGALSKLIIEKRPARFIAVEIDRMLAANLSKQYPELMEIINDDFLNIDLSLYTEELKIVGNIPYNITTPIIFKMIDQREGIKEAVIMMQKEVARRIVAETTENKEYGILSVLCQTYARIEYLFEVKRGNFSPVPQVDSAVLKFIFKKDISGLKDEELFRKIVRSTFNYRRKTLKNSLGRIFDKTVVYSINEFDLTKRPENLSPEQFIQLTNTLYEKLRNRHD